MTSSGAEALDACPEAHHDLDLILMDCEMPIMDGYQTTRAIRSLEKHLESDCVTHHCPDRTCST
jgi:CheY-like chemotaxis protein